MRSALDRGDGRPNGVRLHAGVAIIVPGPEGPRERYSMAEATITTTSASTVSTPATTTWAIDPSHSEVGFAVRHMMISSTKGRFSDITGTIALDEQDLGRSHVEVEIGVASIDTRDEKRDGHLRSSDFFDAESWPT